MAEYKLMDFNRINLSSFFTEYSSRKEDNNLFPLVAPLSYSTGEKIGQKLDWLIYGPRCNPTKNAHKAGIYKEARLFGQFAFGIYWADNPII